MCGINGFVASDNQLIRKMNAKIRHRGPDDEGTFTDDYVSLGCCRLKVIDLSERGHQPMSNEEGDLWITYNGEIYNFSEVRNELENLGYSFTSDSDTEVILHAYEEWGTDAVSKLTGMWAFAIYDSRNEQIVLSRDRTGIKPLYFLDEDGMFAFSSELKVFATLPELRRPICKEGIRDLLIFNFNPGKRTPLDSVYKLGSGQCLIYDIQQRRSRSWRYWTNEPHETNELDMGTLERLIGDVVKDHLVSDVPVGCYVSGGIDSSVVALFYAKHYPGKLHTFHIMFEGHREEQAAARLVADHLDTNHHELELTPNDVLGSFEDLIHYYDMSITDPAFVPNYFLSKYAKRLVTVVLAGEGGDELFAGYDYYRYFSNLKRFGVAAVARKVPITRVITSVDFAINERIMRGLYSLETMNSPEQFLLRYLTVLPEDLLGSILGANIHEYFDEIATELRSEYNYQTRTLSCALLLDQKTLLAENYNYKADKSTCAASLEERVPLQDHRLVMYVNSVPFDYKVKMLKGKVPLRGIVSNVIPELANRRKRGFVTPYREWIRGQLKNKVEAAVMVAEKLFTGQCGLGFQKIYEKFSNGTATKSEERFLWNTLLIVEGLKSYSYLD